MKAAIVIIWLSRNRPGNYGQYKWNQELDCYVWTPDACFPLGRIFDLSKELKEFHVCADKELSRGIQFPNPTIRFLPDPVPVANPEELPIADLVAAYKARSKEARKFQLAQARATKAKTPPVKTRRQPALVS